MEEAKELIMQWKNHYNTERPHSSLNYLSPVDFVKQAA
ncbi:MAG: integrase core domain-containing protein [Ignavibacteriae bacterium]|nr:integrase core domain-containing protein [Ignavibacteriota bacterium]